MESPENFILEFEDAEKLILRWNSTASAEAKEQMIFSGDHREEADMYLNAVDEIQRSMESVKISTTTTTDHHHHHHHQNKVKSTIQIAMARLEDEFRNILVTYTDLDETDYWQIELNSSAQSSFARNEEERFNDDDDEEEEDHPEFENQNTEENHDHGVVVAEEGSSSSSSSVRSRSANYRSTNSIREVDLIPQDAIDDLRNIAERMISAGYLRECTQVYVSVRKQAVEENFYNLVGIEKLTIGDIQKLSWDVLEVKIRRWIRAAKVCVRILFASEKRLCEQIFEGLGLGDDDDDDDDFVAVDESCFMEIIKGPAIQLFNFADAVSISGRSPEKLFKIIDIHDALLDLEPDVELVFESKLFESIRIQASEVLSRLAEATRGMLSEFENVVLREPSQIPVPGGTIHPLTRYVMNYISLISDYKQTLVELIVSKPVTGGGSRYSSSTDPSSTPPPPPEMELLDTEENQSPLALHLIWIIVILQFNLEEKSKFYKDTSLPHLFLMNNVHYILQKIKRSQELREIIGDWYLKKLSGKVRQTATSYQRSTWKRILYCLRDEGLHVTGNFSSGVSRTVLRERFKAFNTIFEEIHRTQVTWTVPDTQLREELRISISENLIPAYRSFLGRFRGHIESGRHPEVYLKYSVEDVEAAVLDFFEGYSVSSLTRKRSH